MMAFANDEERNTRIPILEILKIREAFDGFDGGPDLRDLFGIDHSVLAFTHSVTVEEDVVW